MKSMVRHKEIVLVRVMGSDRDSIIGKVAETVSEAGGAQNDMSIELYCSMSLPTDFSVHLDYFAPDKNRSPSDIGRRLAEALKSFGLISHSVWTLEDK